MSQSWGPIKRDLEIQEAWKLENLEVWRLGGLEAWKTKGLDAGRSYPDLIDHPRSLYRKRFGNPGGLETREPRSLEAGRPGNLGGGAGRLLVPHPGAL